ncbi:MAG: dihydroorotate dehydrogenase electron transfer subunit [Leptotrichiaceae bacterium]|nr:dihydroorotate dehydrogenase electron transfer subunit [Leptotrichiaceae bacterium]
MYKNKINNTDKSIYQCSGEKTGLLENVTVSENKYLGGNNYLMKIFSENVIKQVTNPKAGQFYMLKLKNQIRILRRPVSLHSVNSEKGEVEFLYKVTGKGTEEISMLQKGNILNIQGPLGKGFDICEKSENIIIIGGGIGLAPLKQLIKELLKYKENKNIIFIAGGRNKEAINVLNGFPSDRRLYTVICTDDGSSGEKLNIAEMLEKVLKNGKNPDMIYSCGPDRALKIINDIANRKNIPSQISMEERMACGVGACVGCSVETVLGMKRVCHEGPVFYSSVFSQNRGEVNVN